MRILICGDREWKDHGSIYDLLRAFPPGTVVIHGAAPGADTIAHYYAEFLGLVVEPYPAEWGRLGKPAGPIRNQRMIDEGKPDLAFAFHHNLANSKGTRDMVLRLQRHGIPWALAGKRF